MVAISLQGKGGTYVFSVRKVDAALPECAGFYMLVRSTDKYGIRDRHVLATGYSENFLKDQALIRHGQSLVTHIYLMPDFENKPYKILNDLHGFMQVTKTADAAGAHSGSI